MAAETKLPDSIITQTNLSGTLTDITAQDGNWLTASSNNADSVLHVSFPTPTGPPNTGAGLQNFSVQYRVTANGSSVTFNAYLYENGSVLNGGTAIDTWASTSTTGAVREITWDASLLGTSDGSLVEVQIVATKSGGSPSNRTTGEFGYVDWDVDYSLAGRTGTLSQTLADVTASGAGALTIVGSLGVTLSDVLTSSDGSLSVVGALSDTLGGVTLASAGGSPQPITGDASNTLAEVTAAGTGSLLVQGSSSQSLGEVTGSGTGSILIQGSLSQTIAAVTSSATGALSIVGVLTETVGGVTLVSAGGGVSGPITGDSAISLAEVLAAGSGVLTITGDSAISLADILVSSSGVLAIAGASATTLGGVTLVSGGSIAIVGDSSVTLGGLTLVASAADEETSMIDDIWRLLGLDRANPMFVSASTRTAGTLTQLITGDPATSVTVTRV